VNPKNEEGILHRKMGQLLTKQVAFFIMIAKCTLTQQLAGFPFFQLFDFGFPHYFPDPNAVATKQ
jgi:hypothetical protein